MHPIERARQLRAAAAAAQARADRCAEQARRHLRRAALAQEAGRRAASRAGCSERTMISREASLTATDASRVTS